jgi:hypothetical protein
MNDFPRALASPDEQQRRLGMLLRSYMAQLTNYVQKLRSEGYGDVSFLIHSTGRECLVLVPNGKAWSRRSCVWIRESE